MWSSDLMGLELKGIYVLIMIVKYRVLITIPPGFCVGESSQDGKLAGRSQLCRASLNRGKVVNIIIKCLNKSILCHFVSSASCLSFFSLVTNA